MNLLDSSTLTNQSIASTKLAHTYTATQSSMVMVRVFIDQLSANTGTRSVWLGLLRGGTGSEYRVQMITQSVSVVSAVTAIFSYYGPLPIANTDILKVYVIGVAGDTTTTDIITEIWGENYTLDTVWTDAKAAYLDAAISSVDNGNGGALSLVYTVDVAGVPKEGATVKLFSDSGRTSLVNAKVSNVLGVCTFTNLVAGTYYLTVQMSGYEDLFDSEVVA